METSMVEIVKQVVTTSLKLAREAGWVRSEAKKYTWRNILEATDYDRLNDNEKNYVRSIYASIMSRVWPKNKHNQIVKHVEKPVKVVIEQKEETALKEKHSFRFTSLYEHIANSTGKLPEDKTGNAIATFFGWTDKVAAVTRWNMKNKGYGFTKRDDDTWDVTLPEPQEPPKPPEPKKFSEDEVRKLFDEFLKSKGFTA